MEIFEKTERLEQPLSKLTQI